MRLIRALICNLELEQYAKTAWIVNKYDSKKRLAEQFR